MRGKATLTLFGIAAAVAILMSVKAGLAVFNAESTSLSGINLRCVIDPGSDRSLPGLTVGHNYELLDKFALAHNDSIDIVLAQSGCDYLDSLRRGTVEMVVMPWRDSIQADSISFSIPVEGSTVWAVSSRYRKGLAEIDSWLEEYSATEEYSQRRDLFIYRYSPSRRAAESRTVEAISPYDSIIKECSRELGWDWRLLAAIIYQESKFHIEATSARGARGLMQIRPRTASRFGVSNIIDPEQNIMAGTAFLKRLQVLFKSKAANDSENLKITLAAFNAGEGRITDCINLAGYRGLDSGYWDNIVSVIPQMRDSSIFEIDTVKHGMFYGMETIRYVDEVLGLYEDFKTIYPEKR